MDDEGISIDDAYDILGLDKGATNEEISIAFKKKVLETHPDSNPELKDSSKVIEIINARDLITAKKMSRALYLYKRF